MKLPIRALAGVLLLASLLCGTQALAEARAALVIGNGAYGNAPLANAVNDASDMAAALTASGFEVILRTDADLRAMDEAIDAFAGTLARNGGVGMFYYSGHGVQVSDENYLLPIGGEISHERDVKYGAVNAGQVIDAMTGSGAQLNIVVLDACRNNPLASGGRSATRGLSRVSTGGSGLFVSFSTAPGAVALDGDGRNSPYTKHLVSALGVPGLSLEGVFKEALKGVYEETGGEQVPWISSSFFGDFVFNSAGGAGTNLEVANAPQAATSSPPRQAAFVAAPLVAPPSASRDLDGVYVTQGVNPNGSRYSGMVRIVSGGGRDAYKVDWWIGRQRFAGTGRRDGRWIRVDWGSSSPVIYTLGADGTLDGIWADGKASEILKPHALGGTGGQRDLTGVYGAVGSGANGGTYAGSVLIDPDGRRWRIRWTIGADAYEGIGDLDGRILTVDWGQPSPVIYAVRDDGSLVGLWASGQGTEVLTPTR